MSHKEDELQFTLEEIIAEFKGGAANTPADPGPQEEKDASSAPQDEAPALPEETPREGAAREGEPLSLEERLRAGNIRVEEVRLFQKRESPAEAPEKASSAEEDSRREEAPAEEDPQWFSELLSARERPARKPPLAFPTHRVQEKRAAEKHASEKRGAEKATPGKRLEQTAKPAQKPAFEKDAPWRTLPERPIRPQPTEAAAGKREAPPQPKKEKRARAFVPSRMERPRKPRRFLPYDLINLPSDDAGAMGDRLGGRLSAMAVRLLAALLPVLAAVYLTGAAQGRFPIPEGLSFERYPIAYLAALAALQSVVLALCYEVTLSGLWRLLKGRPTLDTVITLSALASMGYCILSILSDKWRAGLPYVCVTEVNCFFALLAKRQRYEWLRRSCKSLAMGAAPSGVKLYSDGKVQQMAVKTQSGVDVDPARLAGYDDTERFSCFYAPIVLVFCVAMAVSATAGNGQPEKLFWSLSGILAVASPICLLLSSSAPAKRLGKKLYTSGSMIVNSACAGQLSKARAVAVRDADLYPAGAVRITGMKIAEDQEPEAVVGCAASILQEVGGGLSRAFQEFARQQYIVPGKARELRFFDTRGICATVAGRYIQLGTASYLMRMGVHVSEGLKLKNSIFIAIDGRFAGIFSMRYEVQTPVYSAFGLLRQAKLRPVLALRDTTQTQNTVENRFELRRGTAFVPELEERLSYSSGTFGREEETLALLTREGLLPMAEVLCAAKKWKKAARWGLAVGSVSAFLGIVILAFLTGKGSVQAAEPFNVLFYLLLWAIPSKMIRGIITRL